MVTTPTNKRDAIAETSRDDTIDAWVQNDEARSLAGNNTLSGDRRNDVLEDDAGRDKLLKNIATPPISKKPRLEAHWVSENGKLICKWVCYENEEGS
jgi:hypothetical protein